MSWDFENISEQVARGEDANYSLLASSRVLLLSALSEMGNRWQWGDVSDEDYDLIDSWVANAYRDLLIPVTGGGSGGVLGQIAELALRYSTGTDGGTNSINAWTQRGLNTEVKDSGNIVSLSSNRFTLVAGNYRITINDIMYNVGKHRLQLYNYTQSTPIKTGLSGVENVQELTVYTAANGSDEFEVRYWTSIANAGDGLGTAVGDGAVEEYCNVLIEEIIYD